MKTMEYYIVSFLTELKKRNISRVVYTNSVKNSLFITEAIAHNMKLYAFEDARSVGYIGTGMSAEALEPVVICTRGDNEYRSFMPALTEAYYRNLPIIAVTLTDVLQLDNYKSPKDTVINKVFINCKNTKQEFFEKIKNILNKAKPVYVDFSMLDDFEYDAQVFKKKQANKIKSSNPKLFSILRKNLYGEYSLYIDNSIEFPKDEYPEANIIGDGANGLEGRISYVLGASLEKKRKKYIGIITEKSAIHDINAFGNREINERLVYIIFVKHMKQLFNDYANDLSFIIKRQDQLNEIMMDERYPVIYIINDDF